MNPITVKLEDGMYVGYYYDKEVTRQKHLHKALDKLSKWIKSQEDKR